MFLSLKNFLILIYSKIIFVFQTTKILSNNVLIDDFVNLFSFAFERINIFMTLLIIFLNYNSINTKITVKSLSLPGFASLLGNTARKLQSLESIER